EEVSISHIIHYSRNQEKWWSRYTLGIEWWCGCNTRVTQKFESINKNQGRVQLAMKVSLGFILLVFFALVLCVSSRANKSSRYGNIPSAGFDSVQLISDEA
ncbi:unnamed protein product, partial [Choristocarpus tenellus]